MSLNYKGKEIKYIVSDLDGTLVFGEGHKLDDETYDLISRCVDNDVLFIIASGRNVANEQTVLNPIKEKVSYIGNSGSVGVHKGKEIFSIGIDQKDAFQIYDVARTLPSCDVFISTSSGGYTDSKNQAFIDHMLYDVRIEMKVVEDLKEIKDPIEKISAFDVDGNETMQKVFKKECKQFNAVSSGPQWVDFLVPDVNKGSALKRFLKEVGLKAEDGIAFGDQDNDIEMLQVAGIGCCMKTGTENAKQAADFLVDTPKDVMKEMLSK